MPSRQDQLHSHQYGQQRVVSALVTHDPDPHRSPLSRTGTLVLVGLVTTMLVVGGAVIYGLFTGGGTVDARNPAVVFMDQGSGARYVYLAADRRLHPVLNYSSGLLIADAAEPDLVDASTESLAKVPLGDPLGIPDAPDALPSAKGGLVPPVWTVCSSGAVPRSVLSIGERLKGGTVLSEPNGLLVSDSSGLAYLVRRNQRFLIPSPGPTRPPLPVAAAWINAIPIGPDPAPPVEQLTQVRPEQAICVTYEGGSISVRVGPTLPQGVAVPGEPAVPGGVRADLVRVPRGKGAVVVAAASPKAPTGGGTVSIITDSGRRYPLASRDLLTRLGYGKIEPAAIPGQLVALVPPGPALDPVRAKRPGS